MADELVLKFSVQDNGSATIDKVNAKLKQTKEQSLALAPGLEKARGSVTGFVSANAGLIAILAGVGAALHSTIRDHLEYADAVRQQSQVAGTSTEEASRYLQVLDDYKISSSEALAATRALTKEGHAPTIETLAQLSDKYLSLNTAQEKNDFILKNLGRGGLQWVEVLEKGSDAILEQGAAIDKNLILTQKMVDDARKAEVAMDNWTDTIDGLKTAFAVELLPVLTDSANGILWVTKVWLQWVNAIKSGNLKEFYSNLPQILKDTREEIKASGDAMVENADAAGVYSAGLEGTVDPSKEAEEAAKSLSNAYQSLLSLTFDIADQNRNYTESLADLAKTDQEIADSKKRLTLEWWNTQAAGEATTKTYGEYMAQLAELTAQEQDAAATRAQLAEEQKRMNDERLYQMVEERLAADGLIDSGEFEFLQNLAVAKGLVTAADAEQAIQTAKTADAMVASFGEQDSAMQAALATMHRIWAYNGQTAQFGINFTATGMLPGLGSSTGAQSTGGLGSSTGSMDSGGIGLPGREYLIGTGAQPERFTPSVPGTFTPAGKDGKNIEININVGSMRSRQDLDYLAQEVARRVALV